MKVLKFGGTSVGTPERMTDVLKTVNSMEGQKIVVLSAMSGTTNKLKSIAFGLENGNVVQAKYNSGQLKEAYLVVVKDLFQSKKYKRKGNLLIEKYFDYLDAVTNFPYSLKNEKIILAQGEILSTELFHLLCLENKIDCAFLPALDYMKINEDFAPDMDFIQENLQSYLLDANKNTLYITQGYICKNALGQVDNLGRGGSDYTATIIGAVIHAEEVQIWTDIDGMHNNDPRHVEHTTSIPNLSYEEASKLAYFGAKILHPTCVQPVEKEAIPLRIKNTFEPRSYGTLICNNAMDRPKADCVVSMKDKEVLLTIQSNHTLPLNKFSLKIFEVFEKQGIEIDMISIAHQTMALVIEEKYDLEEIMTSLKPYADMELEAGYSIVNLIGQFQNPSKNTLSHIFQTIQELPVKMVSQKKGDCSYLLLLLKSEYKTEVLEKLNTAVLNNKPSSIIKHRITYNKKVV